MKLNRFAIIALAILSAAACKKEAGSTDGSIRFAVASSDELREVTKSAVSDYTSLPSAGAFKISIQSSDNAEVWSGLISEWDASTALNAGNYTVSATYGEETSEGFDKPYFAGSTSFAVQGGQTTTVSIPVELGNSLVKVSCTDSFNNYFPSYSFKVTTGNSTIDFAKGETRAAFIEAFRFTISGTLTNQAGVSSSFSKDYSNLEAKTCYQIAFDADNVGGVTVTVTFNATTETIALGDIELND